MKTLKFKLNGYSAILTDKKLRVSGACHAWELNLTDLNFKKLTATTSIKPMAAHCMFHIANITPSVYGVYPKAHAIGCMQFTPKRWAELIHRTKLAQKKGKGGTK